MNKIYSILKNIFVLYLVIGFLQARVIAYDEKYDWASGYKYKSQDSMDDTQYFKDQKIVGGHFVNNVALMSTWAVTQSNWNATYPQCRERLNDPTCSLARAIELTGNPPADTYTDTYIAAFSYTCSGNVAYGLRTSTDAKNLVGGDTMYGAWSMLFSYFPPVLDSKSCSQFGRCFVGNAFIMDTKAQNESLLGRMWGLGVKELVEGPGDVFYFDQVRAMTQPPKDTATDFNNPVLVGDEVSPGGGGGGACDLSVCDSVTNMPGGTNARDLDGALQGLQGTYMNPYVNPDISLQNFERCYYYVLTQAANNGTDPASAAAVWVEESGASNCERWPELWDLGVIAGPHPDIASQVQLYSNLLGSYIGRGACGSPVTVLKYWLVFFGGDDGCTGYLQNGTNKAKIDDWLYNQIGPIYAAIHVNGHSPNWGNVASTDMGN